MARYSSEFNPPRTGRNERRNMTDNKQKWTTGPWLTVQKMNDDLTVELDNGYQICVLGHVGKASEPNANLIAAAPDLFDALEALQKFYCNNHCGHEDHVQQCRDASKALA